MNNYSIKIDTFIKNKYINTYPPELKDKVLYLIQNGKRLRPILFLIFTGETELENNINNTNITYINYKSKSTIIYIVAILIELLHLLLKIILIFVFSSIYYTSCQLMYFYHFLLKHDKTCQIVILLEFLLASIFALYHFYHYIYWYHILSVVLLVFR